MTNTKADGMKQTAERLATKAYPDYDVPIGRDDWSPEGQSCIENLRAGFIEGFQQIHQRRDEYKEKDKMSEFEFKHGDKVKCAFFGDEIFTLEETAPFGVLKIDTGEKFVSFYKNGTYEELHTHPVLTLVERAKTKVKVSVWLNVHRDEGKVVHYSKELADKSTRCGRIACVELKGEYEI